MTPWIFTENILAGKPITLFNNGEIKRDFTYIDDVIDGILRCVDRPPPDDGKRKPGGSLGPHRIYNLGNNRSEQLVRLIEIIEHETGQKATVTLEICNPATSRTHLQISTRFAPSLATTRPRRSMSECRALSSGIVATPSLSSIS